MPPELQLHLIKTNPQLQEHALRAVAAVEDALGETRGIIAGELDKPDLTDERWRYLIDKLTDNENKATAVTAETIQLSAEQANADRRTKLAIAAMPYVEVVLQVAYGCSSQRGASSAI